MTAAPNVPPVEKPHRALLWLGIVLLIGGFFGHFFAARAIGGSYIAYRDHVAGFILLTVVSGLIVWALGLRFWKYRFDITIFIVGVIQAALGLLVYVQRFSVHG